MKVLEDVGRSTLGFFDYAGGIAELSADAGTSVATLRVRLAFERLEIAPHLGEIGAHRLLGQVAAARKQVGHPTLGAAQGLIAHVEARDLGDERAQRLGV